MNKKILIIFFVILFIVVGVPFLTVIKNIIAIRSAMSGENATTEPVKELPKGPPLLNESNLAGTSWVVNVPVSGSMVVPVTITLSAGGQAMATVAPQLAPVAIQMLGTDKLVGTWSVNGAKFIASVNFQGKDYKVECDIIGDKIYYQNREIQRVS
ncbi:MAG TPA: hypothetical protein PLX23_08990 [Candidatus Hydrogenedens sp.]|nr:hypothetical protein [Candidatus Hydrogenedens sp.]